MVSKFDVPQAHQIKDLNTYWKQIFFWGGGVSHLSEYWFSWIVICGVEQDKWILLKCFSILYILYFRCLIIIQTDVMSLKKNIEVFRMQWIFHLAIAYSWKNSSYCDTSWQSFDNWLECGTVCTSIVFTIHIVSGLVTVWCPKHLDLLLSISNTWRTQPIKSKTYKNLNTYWIQKVFGEGVSVSKTKLFYIHMGLANKLNFYILY